MEFRKVVGYEAFYEASRCGQIRSLWGAGRMLKPIRKPNGYLYVNLCHGHGRAMLSVHGIVAAAFLGPMEPGKEISHIDGRRFNNAADNLCYESHSVNCKRRAQHGTAYRPAGEMHHNAKITGTTVNEIFRLKSVGMLQREIGAKFGLDQSQISRILAKQAWV